MTSIEAIPLRQRKLARTRLALLDALKDQLGKHAYEAVRVRDLCAAAEISEASFFNYFQKKEDLLFYFIQVWSLEVGWHARQIVVEHGALAAIEDVFARAAAAAAEHPRVMAEVLAFLARLERPPELSEMTAAERLLAFPELPGIEDVPDRGLDTLLPELLTTAAQRGELPRRADRRFLYLTLAALFFGTPTAMRRVGPEQLGSVWRAQLALLWKAAGASVPPRKKKRATRTP